MDFAVINQFSALVLRYAHETPNLFLHSPFHEALISIHPFLLVNFLVSKFSVDLAGCLDLVKHGVPQPQFLWVNDDRDAGLYFQLQRISRWITHKF
ncbi:hypothetical protein LguiB_001642 [Lonicera macranthoides]